MKQTPLKRYRAPNYPELNRENEAAVKLLLKKRMPARWKRLAASVAALYTVAGFAEEPSPQQAGVVEVESKPSKEAASQKTDIMVAPISPKLIEYGRASFGCVAVAPAVYLSEAEIKEIIDEELAKAGIRLGPGITLKKGAGEGKGIGIKRTGTEIAFAFPENSKTPLEIAIDWYDPDKKIAVKWLTLDDGVFWDRVARLRHEPCSPQEMMARFPSLTQEEAELAIELDALESQGIASSWSIDLGAGAAFLREEVKTFTGGEGVTLAIFAPPMKPISTKEFRSLIYPRTNQVYNTVIKDYMKSTGRELEPEIRAQVRHFVEWLENQ